jgi:hypothetical protein
VGIFLLAATLVLTLGNSLRSVVGAGVALGLAALVRANLLIFGPLGALYYFCRARRPPPTETSQVVAGTGSVGNPSRSYKTRAAAAPLLFLLGFLLTLGPVTWRNYYVSGEFVMTTSGAGANFYTGNNPANRSGAFEPVPFVRPHPAFEEEDFRAAAEQRLGRRLRATEVSAYWYGRAWDHLKNHPGFGLKVMVRKAMLFWSDFELPDGWDMYLLARYSPVLAWLPIGMAWLLPLGVVGALVEFKRNSAVRLLVGFITFYAAAVILFFIFSRYRVYVLPALAVLAALGLRWIAYAAAARDLRRGVAAAFGMAAVGGLSVFGLKLMAVRMADSAQAFMNLAAVYYEKGDAASAERLLADAMREFPKSPAALCGMGRLQLAKGYWRVSADLLTRCLGHNQRYPQAWFSLGQAYQTGGLLVDAANAYRKQLELVPGHLEAAQMLAEIEVALARSRR